MYSGITLRHRPSGIAITVNSEHSQLRNKQIAERKLTDLVALARRASTAEADTRLDELRKNLWDHIDRCDDCEPGKWCVIAQMHQAKLPARSPEAQ